MNLKAEHAPVGNPLLPRRRWFHFCAHLPLMASGTYGMAIRVRALHALPIPIDHMPLHRRPQALLISFSYSALFPRICVPPTSKLTSGLPCRLRVRQ